MSGRQAKEVRVVLWLAGAEAEEGALGVALRKFEALGSVRGMPREVARRKKLPWEEEPEGYHRVTYEADVMRSRVMSETSETNLSALDERIARAMYEGEQGGVWPPASEGSRDFYLDRAHVVRVSKVGEAIIKAVREEAKEQGGE